MTLLDELMSFILSDKLKEIRNYNCYDELVSKCKQLQRQQLKNINTDTINKQSELLLICLNKLEELGYNLDFEYDKHTCDEIINTINNK